MAGDDKLAEFSLDLIGLKRRYRGQASPIELAHRALLNGLRLQ